MHSGVARMGAEKAGTVNITPSPTPPLPSSSHHQFPLACSFVFCQCLFPFYNLSSCDLPSMMSKTVPFLSNCLLSVLSFLSLAAPRAFSCRATVPIFSSWHFSGSEKCILCLSHLTLHSLWDSTVLGSWPILCLLFLAFWSPKPLWLSLSSLAEPRNSELAFAGKPFLFLSPAVPNSLTDAFQVMGSRFLVPNGFLKPLGSFLLFVVCCWN